MNTKTVTWMTIASTVLLKHDADRWSADQSDLGIRAGMSCPSYLIVDGLGIFKKLGHDEVGTCHYQQDGGTNAISLWND
jgi:hypothetical protein